MTRLLSTVAARLGRADYVSLLRRRMMLRALGRITDRPVR